MKKGRELSEVLQEINQLSQTKEDYIIDTQSLSFTSAGEDYSLGMPGDQNFSINEISHGQIAEAIKIPVKYYNRMRAEDPQLLVNNVNHWFQNNPMKRMVRTLGSDARAFLSDRYRRLDNEDLIEAILPTLGDFPGIRIESCEVTPTRFYIKAVTEKLKGEVAKGDIVYGGVVLSNSEVGWGSLRIEPLIFRLVCTNGMIVPDYGIKRFHIGRVQETDELFTKLTNEAIEADDKAFWLKSRDILHAALSEEVFGKIVNEMKTAKEDEIQINPVDAVTRLSKRRGFSLEEQNNVLANLLKHEESTKFGLSNAVTRTAQDIPSYTRATEFEYLGAEIMAMPKGEWREIAGRLSRPLPAQQEGE